MNHRATHSHHENISESDSQLAPDQISVVEGAINEEDPESRLVIVLKVVEGQLLNNVYLVGENGARFGRHSASNDIVISESFVSRKHCEIIATETNFYLKDLGSTTGTFLMIREKLELRQEMMFQMGLSEFKVRTLQKNIELTVFEGPQRSQSCNVTPESMNHPFGIGRDPANQYFVSEDTQMSNFHAKISYDPELNGNTGGYWLEDVGSTNRTWL